MKTAKKLLAGILAFMMMLALGVPAFAYLGVPKTGKDPYYLLTFGASNTCGYGLHGFLPEKLYDDPTQIYSGGGTLSRDGFYTSGYYFYSDKSYPVLVQKALQNEFGDTKEVILDQFALNSMRAYDLRYLLCQDCPADGYIMWRLGTGEYDEDAHWLYDIQKKRTEKELEEFVPDDDVEKVFASQTTGVRSDLLTAVKRADFITYDLGVNDLSVYIVNNSALGLGNSDYGNDLRNILGDKYGDMIASAKRLLNTALPNLAESLDEETLIKVEGIIDTLAYAYVGFIVSFDKCMEKIYSVNPDVSVAVIGIQNMLHGLTLTIDGLKLPAGDIAGVLVDMANHYTSLVSPYAKRYAFVDMSANGRVEYFVDELRQYDGNPDTLSQNMLDCFDAYGEGLLTSTEVEKYLAYKGITEETICADAVKAAHHAMAYFFKKGADQTDFVIDFDNLNTGKYIEDIKQIAFVNVVDSLIEGKSLNAAFSLAETQIDELVSTPEDRSAIHANMLTGYANCFFYHPTEKGCKQIADAVMRVYMKEFKQSEHFGFIGYLVNLINKMNVRVNGMVINIVRRTLAILGGLLTIKA